MAEWVNWVGSKGTVAGRLPGLSLAVALILSIIVSDEFLSVFSGDGGGSTVVFDGGSLPLELG